MDTGGLLVKHARYSWLLLAEPEAVRQHAEDDRGAAPARRL